MYRMLKLNRCPVPARGPGDLISINGLNNLNPENKTVEILGIDLTAFPKVKAYIPHVESNP